MNGTFPPAQGHVSEVIIRPANEVEWEDFQEVFGVRGVGALCQCQRYKLQPKESFASQAAEVRADRLRMQTGCGDPGSAATSGIVAFQAGEAVGWCAVEPRPKFTGLVRNSRVPWVGRNEDKADTSVWAVTCIFVRAGFRRQGISHVLANAAVDFARSQGAHALEAYPILTKAVISEELHVGTSAAFAAAGLKEVSRPTPRRAVMRLDFTS